MKTSEFIAPSVDWAVSCFQDSFDSAETCLRVIDAGESSMSHPQGPVTIATVNVRAFAPHVEHANQIAALLAAAPQLLNGCIMALDALEGIANSDACMSQFERGCIPLLRSAITKATTLE